MNDNKKFEILIFSHEISDIPNTIKLVIFTLAIELICISLAIHYKFFPYHSLCHLHHTYTHPDRKMQVVCCRLINRALCCPGLLSTLRYADL